jgi:uncharacterized RDD family membrane protein YckC
VESAKLVWRNPWEALKRREQERRLDYRFIALMLFAVMVVLYIIFA